MLLEGTTLGIRKYLCVCVCVCVCACAVRGVEYKGLALDGKLFT